MPARRDALDAMQQEKGGAGATLLAVASRAMPGRDQIGAADERDLIFVGFCVFADPPKADRRRPPSSGSRTPACASRSSRATPRRCVQHLVATLRVPARGLLTGAEIAELTDTALALQVDQVDLFARVSPDQKTRIIRALQPAATPSASSATASTTRRRSAHRRCRPLGRGRDRSRARRRRHDPAGARSRRRRRRRRGGPPHLREHHEVSCGWARVSNFGNMLSMAVASLFLPFLPLTPSQILLNNLLYDLSEIGIPFDASSAPTSRRPQRWDMRGILRFTLIMGPLSSLFDIADVRRPAARLPRRRRSLPDRLVRRIDRDANPGDLPDPDGLAGLEEPAAQGACRHLARRALCCFRLSPHAVGRGTRLRADAVGHRCRDGCAGRRLSRVRGAGEAYRHGASSPAHRPASRLSARSPRCTAFAATLICASPPAACAAATSRSSA